MRNRSLDTAKGFAILLVVLGHVPGLPDILRKQIYSFHVPLFFFLSGLLFNAKKHLNQPFLPFIKGRLKRLILPYACLGLANLALEAALGNIRSSEAVLKALYGLAYSIGKTEYMPNCSPLWFLTALFSVQLLFWLIRKITKPGISYFSFFLLTIAGHFYASAVHSGGMPSLPWNLDIAFSGLGFFAAGKFLANWRGPEMVRNMRFRGKALVLGLSGALWFTLTWFNPQVVGMESRALGNYVYFYLAALSGIVCFTGLSLLVKGFRPLEYLAKGSLIILGFNYAANKGIARLMVSLSLPSFWVFYFVLVLLVLALLIWPGLKLKILRKAFLGLDMQ